MIEEEKTTKKTGLIFGVLGALGILILIGIVFGAYKLGQKQVQPNPSLSPTPFQEALPSPTITPVLTEEPTPTPTSKPKPASTSTPTPTPTAIPTPTVEPKADLYIKDYSFNHPPKKDEPFTVTIVIANQGNANAGAFWWEWKATWALTPCRERITEGIPAGETKTVSCTYTYTSWSTYETKAIVDANNEVVESDEGNNTYTQNVVPLH